MHVSVFANKWKMQLSAVSAVPKMYLLTALHYNMYHGVDGSRSAVGGDWNTIPNPHMDKSHSKTNQGLAGSNAQLELVRGCKLVNVWGGLKPDDPGYTGL